VEVVTVGQMHGAVFWRQGEAWIRNSRDHVEVGTVGQTRQDEAASETQGIMWRYCRYRAARHTI
jgi:hypothetical protein